MTDEDLQSYHKARADAGMPEVSDAQALIEETALLNFMMATYRPGWKSDAEEKIGIFYIFKKGSLFLKNLA